MNHYHHLRLCILLLSICLGRRITEVLLSPRGIGPDGPLTTYPARGKRTEGGLWFRFEPNKDGRQNQVYISPVWHDIAQYCVKALLFYSDEVRHLASPNEQHFFILISEWNLTYGTNSGSSPATEHAIGDDYQHEDLHHGERSHRERRQTARVMTYAAFLHWLSGSAVNEERRHRPGIFERWGITGDGKATSEIYHMRSQQARHTRQSALAQDASISPLIRQRDLNHANRNMQLVYQHHLQQEHDKLRERIIERQLHGLGTYWLQQCLGLVEEGTDTAFREGAPSFLDARWRSLIVNNPLFVQANRVSCGLCAFPQGPDGCPEFMHCTEAMDEGCAWFLTDPNDVQMQTELQERASAHRAKQQESAAAGRTVQAHKYDVMANRTERIRDQALQKASEEVRLALLDELNTYEEEL